MHVVNALNLLHGSGRYPANFHNAFEDSYGAGSGRNVAEGNVVVVAVTGVTMHT